MKAFVVGVKRSSGQFTNQQTGQVIDFDNVVFHVNKPMINSGEYGDEVFIVSVPSRLVSEPNIDIYVGTTCSFEVESLDRAKRSYKASDVVIVK